MDGGVSFHVSQGAAANARLVSRAAASKLLRAAMSGWLGRLLAVFFIISPAVSAQGTTPSPSIYANVHGVVGATDLSMFKKVGSGGCLAPASRPVRGRAKREMTHLACRQRCQSTCLGYTYAPCQTTCTLHGDPPYILNTSDADGWATVNGGGKIERSSGRCGANCYQRMSPCAGGNVVSNTASMSHPPMPFAGTLDLTCPLPYMGTVKVRCGLFNVYIEAGRCKSACPPGVVVTGNFDVPYNQILHGQLTSSACPQGASGTVTLTCLDGQATWASGNCGYDCVRGSIRAGDAILSYPGLTHMSDLYMDCPNFTQGNATLQCYNSLTSVKRGICEANCEAGNYTFRVGNYIGLVYHGEFNHSEENETACEPSSNLTGSITLKCNRGKVFIVSGRCFRHCLPGVVGVGVKATAYGRLDHMEQKQLTCMPGFRGNLIVECIDGNVSIKSGQCMMDCNASSVTSNGVKVGHPYINHTGRVNVSCPRPLFTGTLEVRCYDGAKIFTGECGGNCLPTTLTSFGATVHVANMSHRNVSNFTCPRPWVGELTAFCYDGTTRWIAGFCGQECPAGGASSGGSVIYYPPANHSTVQTFQCQALYNTGLTYSGTITVTCNNGVSTSTGLCYADCPSGTVKQAGSTIYYPTMAHMQTLLGICGPGTAASPLYGMVDVICFQGYATVTGGTCGQPCLAGDFSGPATGQALVAHPDIGHRQFVIATCPPSLSGTIQIYCDNGVPSSQGNGTCGQRCPAKKVDVYGMNVTTPMMEHKASLTFPCNKPGFVGNVLISCDYGLLNITSLCKYRCPAGNTTIMYGAIIVYPNLNHGQLYATACPIGYIGSVTLQCFNDAMSIHTGGCFKHCPAGWFNDPSGAANSWSVSHYEILHSQHQDVTCPQYFNGNLRLSCWSGNVSLTQGFCTVNCRPGRTIIRDGVVVMNQEMIDGQLARTIPCPPGFTGSMQLLCTAGVISLGKGGCNRTCSPAVIMTATHGDILHGVTAQIACPDTGVLTVHCDDGTVTVVSGKCFVGCAAGTVTDANGTQIEHNYIRHNETFSGACIGKAKGNVNLFCNDSVVLQQPRPGERCLRHCILQPVSTADGSLIFPPDTEHGNRVTVGCQTLGLITLKCDDTDFQIIDGQCGRVNCFGRTLSSNGALLSHGAINDGWTAGPATCPAPYLGDSTFFCKNGTSTVNETTMQLPVSPQDFQAIAMGNQSSDDSRFIVCGCCFRPGPPSGPAAVQGTDTGIYIWVAAVGGFAVIMVAGISGWYFLPKKKVSRVWPDNKPVEFQNPRPIADNSYDAVLDTFCQQLHKNPKLANQSPKLLALSDDQRHYMIEKMLRDPKTVVNFFTHRDLQYCLAIEDTKTQLALSNAPSTAPSTALRLAIDNVSPELMSNPNASTKSARDIGTCQPMPDADVEKRMDLVAYSPSNDPPLADVLNNELPAEEINGSQKNITQNNSSLRQAADTVDSTTPGVVDSTAPLL